MKKDDDRNSIATHCSVAFDWWTVRASVYVLLFVAGGWWMLQRDLAATQAAYDAGDLSAFAWTGFWPFIYPMYWILSGAVVAPAAGLIEVCLWIGTRLSGLKKQELMT